MFIMGKNVVRVSVDKEGSKQVETDYTDIEIIVTFNIFHVSWTLPQL